MSYELPTRLVVIANPGGALERFWEGFGRSQHRVEGMETLLIAAGGSLASEKIVPDGDALLLLLTDAERVQRWAVRLKLRRRAPVIVLRWWDERPRVRRTLRNGLIFGRYTGVNFLPSREALVSKYDAAADELAPGNPVVLDQPGLGAEASFEMMRHALHSLSRPSRVDFAGRERRDHGHLRLAVATHFYCNQENIGTVTSLLEEYAGYPSEVLDRVQFVVVDDGSPIRYEVPELDLNLVWVRIDQDIRWNQAGARNLALLYARANNVVISDVDHLFPAHTLAWLLGRDASHRRFYRFYRQRADGTFVRGHPNIFYLARARFFELFGTDEEFAGAYGAEDVRFVRTAKYHGTVLKHLPKRYYCVERKLDRSRSYHSLFRDLSFNTPVDTRKRMEVEYFGADYGHSRRAFDFTWTVLADRERRSAFRPRLDRGWRQRWWLRQLASLLCPC